MTQKINRMLARGAESRARLLDAAIKCFARSGFDGTSVRAIADEAGVTFQLIRHHFGSKEDLWLAAAMRLWDKAQDLLERALSPPPQEATDPKRAFRHFALTILEYNAKNPEFRRIYAQEYFADSERYRKILKPYGRKFSKQQLDVLQRRADDGLFARFSPEEAMLIFRSLVAGTVMLRDEYELLLGRSVSSRAALEYEADLLVNLLFDGHGVALVQGRRDQRIA